MTTLTTAQATTLKNFIAADGTLSQIPKTTDGAYAIVAALNVPVTTFWVWQTQTNVSDIYNNILWANFTPNAPASGAGTDAANYMLFNQGKQFNLQILIGGGSPTLATSKVNIIAGLQDSLTGLLRINGVAVPAGGGWPAVQLSIQRNPTVLEKLFAATTATTVSTGVGTQANPATLIIEGGLQPNDILNLWAV